MKYLTLLLFVPIISSLSGQEKYISNFLEKWENAANYTLECANLMPEDAYDFKPTEAEMSFSEQLIHMTKNMLWLSHSYLGGDEYDRPLDNDYYSKEEIIQILNDCFKLTQEAVINLPIEDLHDEVDFFAGPMDKQKVMMLMNDHMTHHRGQLIVYLRLNDIKPPRYRGW